MPEGPEVLRCGEQLRGLIKGTRLYELKPLSGKLSRKMQPIEFTDPYGGGWRGISVTDVIIKGKTIFVQLADGREIVSTLGMSGRWYPPIDKVGEMKVYSQGKLIPAVDVVLNAMKHARVELMTSEGSTFYIDPRNFGNLKIVTTDEAQKIRQRMGIDMLGQNINGVEAVHALRKEASREIGEVLLDQDVLCGIGNMYRAEALYLAKLNPYRRVSSLSLGELRTLIEAIVLVLNVAYKFEGTLIYPSEVVATHGHVDPFHDAVRGPLVYSRKTDLFGHEVNSHVSAGRTIWWVPTLQL